MLGDGEDAIHLLRARMLAAAAPPESLGGGAGRRLSPGPCAKRSAPRAVALAQSVGYRGAGTLEYLYDEASRRLLLHRDEHPHPGRASGDRDGHRHRPRAARCCASPAASRCAYRQYDIALRGHAIEVRINAEDPARQLHARARPHDARFARPGGEGVRFDTMLYEGYAVPPFYDSLLGKLIVCGRQSRRQALEPPARARCDELRSTAADDARASSRACSTPKTCAPATSTRAGSRIGWPRDLPATSRAA